MTSVYQTFNFRLIGLADNFVKKSPNVLNHSFVHHDKIDQIGTLSEIASIVYRLHRLRSPDPPDFWKPYHTSAKLFLFDKDGLHCKLFFQWHLSAGDPEDIKFHIFEDCRQHQEILFEFCLLLSETYKKLSPLER